MGPIIDKWVGARDGGSPLADSADNKTFTRPHSPKSFGEQRPEVWDWLGATDD